VILPLNTPVQQGEVIGVARRQRTSGEWQDAGREIGEADREVADAEESLRLINDELNARSTKVGKMSSEEIAAAAGELKAEEQFARQETLFRSGLASELDYDSAILCRATARATLDSVRSDMTVDRVAIDEWQAKAQEAQARLSVALERRNAARALARPLRPSEENEPVFSPADGMLVASEGPERVSVGIASDPCRVLAYGEFRQSDLISIRVGERAAIVLDAAPSVTFQATVSEISELPVDSTEGEMYRIAFSVENPGRTWLTGVAAHVKIQRLPR
jgi:multidrug resistance efflux pump